MTEEDQPDRRAIYVPEDVAAAAALPEDLDSAVTGPYSVPNTARRRRAGAMYFIGAALTAAAIIAGLPLRMWLTAVAVMVAIGGYHFVAGWKLEIRERRALEVANRAVGFPIGHTSASLGFSGWRAKPVWGVLVFSADDPPAQRALVRVDAINGSVLETYREAIPET